MIKELIAVANSLDAKGFSKEADALDLIIKKAMGEYDFADVDQIADELPEDFQDYEIESADRFSNTSPEQKLITMIHASEELAKRLGLSHYEADMTANELRTNLIDVLDLENLSPEDVDKVLELAARLVRSPAEDISSTPRVRVTE